MDLFSGLALALTAAGMSGGSLFVLNLYRKGKKAKETTLGRDERPTYEEVPRERVPGRLQYEIVRQKDDRTVVVKRSNLLSMLSPKREFLDFQKRSFFADHIIKETKGKRVRYFVRWNLYFSEAYDSFGNLDFNHSLETIRRNFRKEQLIQAAGQAVGFSIDNTMLGILILAMIFGIPIGFSYNDLFHWVPTTVVHWVPR